MLRAPDTYALPATSASGDARSPLEQQSRDSAANWRVDEAVELLSGGTAELTEWDESVIRQLVETVKVISKEKILVTLQGGIEVEQQFGKNLS